LEARPKPGAVTTTDQFARAPVMSATRATPAPSVVPTPTRAPDSSRTATVALATPAPDGALASTVVWFDAYVTNVDPNWYYRGLAASAGYFYSQNTAHYSFRQARMENCVLKFGCIGSEYPWVKIWAYGDGSYRWERGT